MPRRRVVAHLHCGVLLVNIILLVLFLIHLGVAIEVVAIVSLLCVTSFLIFWPAISSSAKPYKSMHFLKMANGLPPVPVFSGGAPTSDCAASGRPGISCEISAPGSAKSSSETQQFDASTLSTLCVMLASHEQKSEMTILSFTIFATFSMAMTWNVDVFSFSNIASRRS
ncbi:unnamed protein product [Prorocentrum cordatum]|uniref:Uncharacterized protein n=1 Tax=Prorocentrum cordatum TaxID=2364126 RepID=A0ABN9PCM2_9DINO|nr:unnamed protein product [Polarella glacialis]